MSLFEDTEDEKRCAMCGRMLPATWFNRSRQSADGLQSYCRNCQKQYRRKHPDKEYKYGKGTPEEQLTLQF